MGGGGGGGGGGKCVAATSSTCCVKHDAHSRDMNSKWDVELICQKGCSLGRVYDFQVTKKKKKNHFYRADAEHHNS